MLKGIGETQIYLASLEAERESEMAKVTGLGGVFYKVADPAATQAWYQEISASAATGARCSRGAPRPATIPTAC